MKLKIPKNTSEYLWTAHSVFKMRQYGLSEQRVKNVIKKPKRKEEGIVKNTVAVMQPVSVKIINGKEMWKQEIWAMYQKRGTHNFAKSPHDNGVSLQHKTKENFPPHTKYKIPNTRYKIISAWRYPGVSPKNNPIPEEILQELGGAK